MGHFPWLCWISTWITVNGLGKWCSCSSWPCGIWQSLANAGRTRLNGLVVFREATTTNGYLTLCSFKSKGMYIIYTYVYTYVYIYIYIRKFMTDRYIKRRYIYIYIYTYSIIQYTHSLQHISTTQIRFHRAGFLKSVPCPWHMLRPVLVATKPLTEKEGTSNLLWRHNRWWESTRQ